MGHTVFVLVALLAPYCGEAKVATYFSFFCCWLLHLFPSIILLMGNWKWLCSQCKECRCNEKLWLITKNISMIISCLVLWGCLAGELFHMCRTSQSSRWTVFRKIFTVESDFRGSSKSCMQLRYVHLKSV